MTTNGVWICGIEDYTAVRIRVRSWVTKSNSLFVSATADPGIDQSADPRNGEMIWRRCDRRRSEYCEKPEILHGQGHFFRRENTVHWDIGGARAYLSIGHEETVLRSVAVERRWI